MNYHPISYSPPMVRARRAGLKTQTRRLVKGLQFVDTTAPGIKPYWRLLDHPKNLNGGGSPMGPHIAVMCPYGQPGDRLWIKEEHYLFGTWHIDGRRKDGKFKLRFEADRSMGVLFEEPNGLITGRHTGAPGWYKRIGMFMPRWASRDTDEIVSVRVERLQDISEADAIAEGIEPIQILSGHPAWAISLRDQCVEAGVPYLFKQWGEWQVASVENGHHGSVMPETGERYTWVGLDGRTQNPSGNGLTDPYAMAKVGKKATGRLLDGRTWDEVPA